MGSEAASLGHAALNIRTTRGSVSQIHRQFLANLSVGLRRCARYVACYQSKSSSRDVVGWSVAARANLRSPVVTKLLRPPCLVKVMPLIGRTLYLWASYLGRRAH